MTLWLFGATATRSSSSSVIRSSSATRLLNPRGAGGRMRTFEIGVVLPMWQSFVDGSTSRWVEIRELATRAEEIGFDTVWTADELLWRPADGKAQGWWECVAMT